MKKMPQIEIHSCKECKFWRATQVVSGISATDIIIHGECHRFPPSRVGTLTAYPITGDTGWCGEWRWEHPLDEARYAINNHEKIKEAAELQAQLTSANQK